MSLKDDIEEIKNSCVRTETDVRGLKADMKKTDDKVNDIRDIVTRHDERINQLAANKATTGNRTWQVVAMVVSGFIGALWAKITDKHSP